MLWVKFIFYCFLLYGYNCIIIGVVYYFFILKDDWLFDYLINIFLRIECFILNVGILFIGDFNWVDIF